MQIKPYKKSFEYTYSLGVFPTLELLEHKSDSVVKILLTSNSMENTGVKKIFEISKKQNIEVEINDKAINRISKKDNVYAVGILNKYCDRLKPGNHIVLVNPSDMGNLGTIIRTALGFNICNIGIISPGVDKFDPKVIRGSMGAVFRSNIEYFESFEDYIKAFPDNKKYAFMLNGDTYLQELETPSQEFTLIFGNEGSGLDEDYFKHAANGIKIKQSEGIDSFNLGISVGIACYEFTKKCI